MYVIKSHLEGQTLRGELNLSLDDNIGGIFYFLLLAKHVLLLKCEKKIHAMQITFYLEILKTDKTNQ